jgi:cathepsin A (carboxypeptidase C)
VLSGFLKTMDRAHSTHHYVEALLEHGVKVLIYAGMNDLMTGWAGQEKMVHLLDWSGKQEFSKAELKPWYIDSKNESKAGDMKTHGGLSFVTIEGAGHLVSIAVGYLFIRAHEMRQAPYDKPDESLWMVNQWLDSF